MARPLRIELPGAVYHGTSRGDRHEEIFVDDEDRQGLLAVVAHALAKSGVRSCFLPRAIAPLYLRHG